jgi:hypothetical protein
MENQGDGSFVNISSEAGSGMKVTLSTRGAGFGDLDNDGDVDIVISNSRRGPTLLKNDTATGNHWLGVRLQGVKCNRDGVGSHVTVIAGDLKQFAEVHSGRGYQSHSGLRLHFGLGRHEKADRLEVRWLGGGTDTLKDVPANQFITIKQTQREDES